MRLIKETCVAGHVIDVSYKIPCGPERRSGRAKKSAPSKDAVKRINQRNAEKDLARKLNHNFGPKDWHIVLTYAGEEPSPERAKADREAFIKELRKLYKNLKIHLKWITATEYMHDRIHHHMVVTYAPFEELAALWTHGDVRPSSLKQNRNYRKLASYLIKETSKTYNQPGSVTKRRYNCSRSVITPEVRRDFVGFVELADDPKPVKGYYIDQDSIRRGVHEVTGYPYLEYEMVSLTQEPRLKRWPRGRRIKNKDNYNYILRGIVDEEQLILPNYEGVLSWDM